MPPGLKLIFSGINIRNIDEHPIETALIDDFLTLLGKERKGRRGKEDTVCVRKITSAILLETLIKDFVSIKGLISLDRLDMQYLYESEEVAYAVVPIGNGDNRLHHAFEILKSSIGSDFFNYTHFFINLKFSELDNTPMVKELQEVNDFFSYMPETFEIKWGFCNTGIRSEIFFILAK